jgi:hypothetical protein
MVGYLAAMILAQIRVLTGEPDYSELECEEYDWAKTVYGDIREQVLEGIPDPLGNYITLSHYYNANLYHDVVTGQSVTGILHFMNKMHTPRSKLQWKQQHMAANLLLAKLVLTKSLTSN